MHQQGEASHGWSSDVPYSSPLKFSNHGFNEA